MHRYRHPCSFWLKTKKLKELCLLASGLEELKVGFVAFSTMEKISANHPINDETEVEMTWSPFTKRFEKKYQRIMKSCECFFTGKSSTVIRSTIRMTKQRGNLALVMQMDTGKFVVAVSKAQGCDEPIGLDAKFLGWARDYDAPFFTVTRFFHVKLSPISPGF